jgi:hypothetical protein
VHQNIFDSDYLETILNNYAKLKKVHHADFIYNHLNGNAIQFHSYNYIYNFLKKKQRHKHWERNIASSRI